MLFLPCNTDATIDFDLKDRPDVGTLNVALYSSVGSVVSSSLPYTLNPVSASITAAVSPGATTLTLDSSANVARRSIYLVEDTEENGGEQVTVKSISGNALTLLQPILMTHPSGSAFYSTRATVSLLGAAIPNPQANYRLQFTYKRFGVTQAPEFLSFDVVRYNPVSYLTIESMRTLAPAFNKYVSGAANWQAIKDRTWDMLLIRIKSNVSPGSIIGTLDLTSAHAYLVESILAEQAGSDFADYAVAKSRRAFEELNSTLSVSAVDNNMDGVVSPSEGYWTSVKLVRG